MSEEIEVPLEQTQEDIHAAAHNAHEKWISRVALYSALLAAIAAVSAMMAGHHSDEAMITQIRAADAWSHFQAKGIKAVVLAANQRVLKQLKSADADEGVKTPEEYKQDQKEISDEAKEFESESEMHLKLHSLLAKAVTFFQVAIAIAAISVLTRRQRYWLVSMGFSLIGLMFFIMGIFTAH